MKVELNIGLASPKGAIALRTVEDMLNNSDFCVANLEIRQATSSTEETAVVRLVWLGHRSRLCVRAYDWARRLNQEAIAIYYPETHAGELVGPKAEAWGEFNHNEFIRYQK